MNSCSSTYRCSAAFGVQRIRDACNSIGYIIDIIEREFQALINMF